MEYTSITSRKNETVTRARLLSTDKKERDTTGLFALEGYKLLEEAEQSGLCVRSVFFTDKALASYAPLLEKCSDASLYHVTDEVFEKLSTEAAPQGLYACVQKPADVPLSAKSFAEGSLILLEDVQNPANLGAIVRSAFAFGFDRIVYTAASADPYSPKTVRAAMGSLFRIRAYRVDTLSEVISPLCENGNRVFCTLLSDTSVRLGDVSFLPSDSFVIGNEGHGASAETAKACSHSLYIPMKPGAESLNAASAASVVLWEAGMRRTYTK